MFFNRGDKSEEVPDVAAKKRDHSLQVMMEQQLRDMEWVQRSAVMISSTTMPKVEPTSIRSGVVTPGGSTTWDGSGRVSVSLPLTELEEVMDKYKLLPEQVIALLHKLYDYNEQEVIDADE